MEILQGIHQIKLPLPGGLLDHVNVYLVEGDKGNLMIDLDPSNAKLRDRAIRIVSQLGKCSRQEARRRLASHHWNVRACLADPT